MRKKSKITLIVLVALIGLVYAAFLFVAPAVVNLNNFKPEIQKAAKDAAGLGFDAENLQLDTYFDLSAGVTAENAEVKTPQDKKLLKFGKASIRVPLLPLIFRKLEIAEVRVINPEIFLTRLKNGKYNVESIIEKASAPQQSAEKNVADNESEPSQLQEPPFELEFNGLNVLVNNYSVNLKDMTVPQGRNFMLKGDIIKIEDFDPEKYAKILVKGAFLVEDNPRINYDVAIATGLPIIKEEKKEEAKDSEEQEGSEKQVNQKQQRIDPLEGLIKYDFKGDIAADLRLKEKGMFPEIDGFLKFDKLSFKVDERKLPDSYGSFKFKGKKIDVDSKLFIIPESYVKIAGKVKNLAKQDFNINVKTTDILLTDVKKFAYSFADALNVDVQPLNDIGLAGKLKADFNLTKDNYQGYLDIINARLSHKRISRPLENFNSSLKFDKDRVVIEKTAGSIGDIGFNVTGNVTSELVSDIKADIPNINLATVMSLINNSPMFADLRPQFKDFRNVSGSLSANATVKGRLDKEIKPEVVLSVNKISANHAAAGLPVAVNQGKITSDGEQVMLKNIKAVISYSPINISGKITDLTRIPEINIMANGEVSPADIKKYAPKEAQKAVKSQGLPILATITGTPEDLDLVAQTNIDNLASLVRFDQPAGTTNIINFNANVRPTSISIKDAGLFAGSNLLKNKSGLYNLGSATGLVSVKGDINSVQTPDPYLHDIKIDISGLNLILVEPKGNIQVNGNLLVKGRTSRLKAYGTLNLRNVDIPSMYIKTDRVDVTLKEKDITVDTAVVNIIDSKLVLSAILENKLSPPYQVKSVKVSSDFINIDKLSQAFASAPQAQSRPVNRSNNSGMASGGSKQQLQDVPVIIHNGKFSAGKLIASNLLNKDLTFDFTIKPLNMLAIRNFLTHVGGGTASGMIDMNLKISKLSLDCTADNVEINALASTLAQTPNEIFGGMNGRIKLTTIGQTPEAMTMNAVGRTDFMIENGHMPRLANLEYLLSANNLSVKGITDSVLSNNLQSEEAAKTHQFDTLEGLVLINRGMLNVQEIKMQGKYLSSFITGTVQMKNNHADLTMLSTLSGRVVKNLGAIKDLSMDKLIRKIPGEWVQLLADQRIANQYPNRDRIPPLNAEPRINDKDFAVQIEGILGQPRAVRMFEWLPDENHQ